MNVKGHENDLGLRFNGTFIQMPNGVILEVSCIETVEDGVEVNGEWVLSLEELQPVKDGWYKFNNHYAYYQRIPSRHFKIGTDSRNTRCYVLDRNRGLLFVDWAKPSRARTSMEGISACRQMLYTGGVGYYKDIKVYENGELLPFVSEKMVKTLGLQWFLELAVEMVEQEEKQAEQREEEVPTITNNSFTYISTPRYRSLLGEAGHRIIRDDAAVEDLERFSRWVDMRAGAPTEGES